MRQFGAFKTWFILDLRISTTREVKTIELTFSIIAMAFLFNSCTTKQNTNGAVGVPAISIKGKYTAVLIAESEGTTYQKNGGYHPTNYKNIYW